MTVKIKNENYFSVEDLIKILKLNENFVNLEIREGRLKGQYFVLEKDLDFYLKQKKVETERKTRLLRKASELEKTLEQRNSAMVENLSYKGQDRRQFKIWEM